MKLPLTIYTLVALLASFTLATIESSTTSLNAALATGDFEPLNITTQDVQPACYPVMDPGTCMFAAEWGSAFVSGWAWDWTCHLMKYQPSLLAYSTVTIPDMAPLVMDGPLLTTVGQLAFWGSEGDFHYIGGGATQQGTCNCYSANSWSPSSYLTYCTCFYKCYYL